MTGTPRQQQIAAISEALGDRSLAWFGIRGHDAAALLPIPQFTEAYAVTAPLRASKLSTSLTLEELTGQRVDLDAYDIDFDDRPEVTELRRVMLTRLRHASTVCTYRPSHFLDAIAFASRETCEYLGLFKGRQSVFEHKPWVETQLSDMGIRTIPWRYVADEYRDSVRDDLRSGPQILRASTRSGGVGIEFIDRPEDIPAKWPMEGEHFIAVAPFLADAIPINVGACVFDRETITLHPGSIQLVGIRDLTNRRFGYCGNDFAAFRGLDRRDVATMTETTIEVGRWMATQGFVGAFGIDFMVDDTGVYFAEINARFQGSTALTTTLSAETDHVDIMLDHVAAVLGLAPREQLTLGDWADELPPAAHAIAHNTTIRPASLVDLPPTVDAGAGARFELVPDEGVVVEPGAILFRSVFDRQITRDGFELEAEAASTIRRASNAWEIR